MTLQKRMARAEQRQKRYRECPDYRLAAINRTRRNAGRPTLASLEHSAKLHRPLEVAIES